MNPTPGTDNYDGKHLVLLNPVGNPYQNEATLVKEPNTSGWYKTQYGCLRTDPTLISRMHTFPDVVIPRGIPEYPAPPTKVCSDSVCDHAVTSETAGCTEYRTAWPQRTVDPTAMIETAMNHPQFAFRVGGPATPYQIGVESQLRRLDQPLTKNQAIIPEDAPLYKNTVAPPPVYGVPEGVQNASNPIAAMVRQVGAEACRQEADAVAMAMSGRWANNPTRQDTKRFDRPFSPPGIGSGSARPTQPLPAGQAFYA